MLIRVVGGGLAGCEAALYLSKQGYEVELFDTKPSVRTAAHTSANFGELVCSNSLKSNVVNSAAWLLKEEMRRLGSSLLPIADETRVPSGGALAVDRDKFCAAITACILASPFIKVIEREVTSLDDSVPTILATGPLTSAKLAQSLSDAVGDNLFFFDAAAPIIDATSIDNTNTFSLSRYDQGDGDYLNCPLTRDEYNAFVGALVTAKTASLKDFEGKEVFEGCMPIEVMAKRGVDTLRYGPLKPVGLGDCYAAVQLRAEDTAGSSYNLVGFQTNLLIPEQKRVFSMIPALKRAEYFRYGAMHRNTYLDCPKVLDATMCLRGTSQIYVAGQLSGVEGYTESMASGLIVAHYLDQRLRKGEVKLLPRTAMTGALFSAISIKVSNFQPVNANYGILPPTKEKYKDKITKYAALAERALKDLSIYLDKEIR